MSRGGISGVSSPAPARGSRRGRTSGGSGGVARDCGKDSYEKHNIRRCIYASIVLVSHSIHTALVV